MNRRAFLGAAATAAAAVPLEALISRVEAGEHRPSTGDYGPLVPVNDETTGWPLLMLPEGFRYLSLGWTGEPMLNGRPTPGAHDGMAAFDSGDGLVTLIRNHELGQGTPFSAVAYDVARGAGGTTNILFDSKNGEYVSTRDSLSGTLRNCAGGPTPWNSWLTCEETTEFTGMPHGYVFDVPVDGMGDPLPIRDMGRFSHEALAVDPESGDVYLTEDAGNASGFYRYVPNVKGNLAGGGRLYMLKVGGVKTSNHNLFTGYPNNTRFWADWVEIDQPDNTASIPGNFVSAQGRAQGAAYFGRLEGAWYDGTGKIYFVSTNGGAVGQGQIWEYHIRKGYVRLVFESPGSGTLNAPDNITVSPRGGLVLCEDGSGTEYVHGLTVTGEIFRFAQNNVILPEARFGVAAGIHTGSEFAGACYSPDGKWLFVNVQGPGITFAITGPWRDGAL